MTLDLTVCICTRNRPDDLESALESVVAARPSVAAIVVADDSTDDRTSHLISERYPQVGYIEGPRRGLGANRNAALSRVQTSHAAFIDDDARLNPGFVAIWRAGLVAHDHRAHTIVTGGERNAGRIIHPHAVTFLGHQARPYRPNERLHTLVINATVFPCLLFEELRFDEALVYGSDEVDIAMNAVARGYNIVWIPTLLNDHHPSPVNREYYRGHAEAARLYVTMKRYARVDRSLPKAAVFAVVGPLHLLCHAARRGGCTRLISAAKSIGQARRMLVGAQQQRRRQSGT